MISTLPTRSGKKLLTLKTRTENADPGQFLADAASRSGHKAAFALGPPQHWALFPRSLRVTNRHVGVTTEMSTLPLRVQSVSATRLVVYRLAFRSPRSFADAD